MGSFFSKRIVKAIIVLIVLGVGILIFIVWRNNISKGIPAEPTTADVINYKHEVIGSSVQGRMIDAYTFGTGAKHIIFVGGIHGGYEWNSVLLAYQFFDYLKTNSEIIPANMTVTVIPAANPDGIFKAVGKEGRFTAINILPNLPNGTGRFNAVNVDLNRNFDCKWQATSTWQNNIVSAGTKAFSEPEAKAIRDFVLKDKPVAVIFWHSQSNAVYASECKLGVLPETVNIMNTYSLASGYPAVKAFTSYQVTGDAEGWLASINIPAITVELKTHEAVEWDKNLAGIKALFNYYKTKTKI